MEKFRRFAALTRLAYTRPHTVSSAKRNLIIWTGVMLLAVGNIGLNLMLTTDFKWFWLGINTAMLCTELLVFRYAVIGWLWRKNVEADKAAFYAIVRS